MYKSTILLISFIFSVCAFNAQTVYVTCAPYVRPNEIFVLRPPFRDTTIAHKAQDTNANAITFINYWLGLPYRYGGKDTTGIDCSAFTQRFYKDVFVKTIPRTAKMQFTASTLTRIKKQCLKTGDLIFFKSTRSPSGWHVGVYLWGESFIHSANKKVGVIISNLNEYSNKIIGYRRTK